MMSQTRQQTVVIHILPDISGSKGNQIMKFGQLIQHNMKNIWILNTFLKNHVQNVTA